MISRGCFSASVIPVFDSIPPPSGLSTVRGWLLEDWNSFIWAPTHQSSVGKMQVHRSWKVLPRGSRQLEDASDIRMRMNGHEALMSVPGVLRRDCSFDYSLLY